MRGFSQGCGPAGGGMCGQRRHPLRMAVIVIVGAAAIFAVRLYRRYHLERPMGEGPAGPAVTVEPFDEPWTDRKVLLLGLGDSVTAGFGVRHDLSYFNRLVENPADEFADMKGKCLSAVLPNLAVENRALSGSTSIHCLESLRENAPKQPEDVFGLVVMTTGGNDLIHNYGQTPPTEGAMYGATLEEAEPWIANFEERLAEILDRVEAAFPGGCLIFLADIYDPSDGVGDAPNAGLPHWEDALAILDRYNATIRAEAKKRANVVLVPMHAQFLGHGIHCTNRFGKHYHADDPSYWYGTNLEDPNERGYDALRRLFLKNIVEHRGRIGGTQARREPQMDTNERE